MDGVRAQPKLVKQTSLSAFFTTTKPLTRDTESGVLPGTSLVDETKKNISILKRQRDGEPKYRTKTTPKTTPVKTQESKANPTAKSENFSQNFSKNFGQNFNQIKKSFAVTSVPGKPKKMPTGSRVRSTCKPPGQSSDGRKQILITQLLKPNPKSGESEWVSEARTKRNLNI